MNLCGTFVESGNGTISLSYAGATPAVYQVDEHVQVEVNGKPAKLADLKKGDKVTTRGDGDIVSLIRVERDETAHAAPAHAVKAPIVHPPAEAPAHAPVHAPAHDKPKH